MQINSLASIFKFYEDHGNLPGVAPRPLAPDQAENDLGEITDLFKDAINLDNSSTDFNLQKGIVACSKGGSSYSSVYRGDASSGQISVTATQFRDREFHLVDAQPTHIKGLWVWWDHHGPVTARAIHLDRQKPEQSTVQEIGWVHTRERGLIGRVARLAGDGSFLSG